MKNLVCAICERKTLTKRIYRANFDKKSLTSKVFSARRTPDRIHYQFLQCQVCGLIFSSPIFSKRTIINLYKQSNFTYGQEASFLADTYGSYLEKILPKKGRNKIKLLDIGCGNGFFLEKAKALGVGHVYGIEPGKASADKAPALIKKNIVIDILRPNIFKNNYFDIICCFHTLDHIIDPTAFLKIVYKLLKKNGSILFVTHTTKGLSVKLFGERSPIFDIEHIYLFNEQTLARILIKHGFNTTQVYNLKNTYPLLYWLRLTPMATSSKKVLMYVLASLKIGNIPLAIPAGNIAITAKK